MPGTQATMKPCVGQLRYYLISRSVSDLVDYSSCRRLFLFPEREFFCASSQEFIQQDRARSFV